MKIDHNKVRKLREDSRLTLEKLSYKIKISVPTLHAIEKGKNSHSMSTLNMLAKYYNIDVKELIIIN